MFKILVVEDDKALNQTVCAYLNKNGYEAFGCLSANDAYSNSSAIACNISALCSHKMHLYCML